MRKYEEDENRGMRKEEEEVEGENDKKNEREEKRTEVNREKAAVEHLSCQLVLKFRQKQHEVQNKLFQVRFTLVYKSNYDKKKTTQTFSHVWAAYFLSLLSCTYTTKSTHTI